jgi:hypothetical protein
MLCCVVIELFNLRDPLRVMQKTYLFPEQIGLPLANASTSSNYCHAVNVQSLDIGKLDI